MTRVHKAKVCEAKKFAKPDDIISVKICTKCGNLAVPGLCENALGGSTVRKEYFAKGTQPLQNCSCYVRSPERQLQPAARIKIANIRYTSRKKMIWERKMRRILFQRR